MLTKHRNQRTLDNRRFLQHNSVCIERLDMPRSINWNKMREIYDFQPKNYEELLSLKGVGPKSVRALALISDLIYGEKPSWQDSVIRFTFAHGGKDGIPYPVDKKVYDQSIEILQKAIRKAKVSPFEKDRAFKRLVSFNHR